MNESKIIVYLKLIFTMLVWGGTFVAAKSISHDISPASASFLRFFIASFGLLILIYQKEGKFPRIKVKSLPFLLLLGLTGVAAYNIFFFWGLQTVDAGRASLIIAMNPVLIFLFSVLLFKEKATLLNVLGVMISVSGAMLLISRGEFQLFFHGGFNTGDLLIFGCVLSWVSYSMIGKLSMKNTSALHSVFYSTLFGSFFLFIPAVNSGLLTQLPGLTFFHWSMLAYLGIFATVIGFYWYYQGIQSIGVARAGIFINIVPLSSFVLSIIFYGEKVSLITLISGLLVISGVFLTNFSRLVCLKSNNDKTVKSH